MRIFGLGIAFLIALTVVGCASGPAPSDFVEIRLAVDAPEEGKSESDYIKATTKDTKEEILMYPRPVVTEQQIESADRVKMVKGPAIGITFTEEGFKRMSRATEGHRNARLALVLEGQVVAAPIIASKITTPSLLFAGGYSEKEVTLLVSRINSLLLTGQSRLKQ